MHVTQITIEGRGEEGRRTVYACVMFELMMTKIPYDCATLRELKLCPINAVAFKVVIY